MQERSESIKVRVNRWILKKLLNTLSKIIVLLESIHRKYLVNAQGVLGYSSLSPIDNGDENGHYSKALLWALKNRKTQDIKNIALTGPYGSGKSSIIKTFQKKYRDRDLKFLNISLATFTEENPKKDNNGSPIKTDKSELLRLIETSILEQIFYHEEDNKIPDSRFKKIKSYSTKNLVLISLGYLLFIISIYNYTNPGFIQNTFKEVIFEKNILGFIHYGGLIVIALGLFFIIFKSIRIISTVSVNKLKIQNAEISLGDSSNKSILNHHIDEILYFFSIRPYNVVVIEDLDRFKETEIFTKLREVNLLLNSSQKTQRKEIVFVYAVRDDMFTDRERTKFFDFIIPVIPVINSSNSAELIFKKKHDFNFNLTDTLIEDIAFFIDDMRLLHNISNEFYLYKEKLNENLIQDKLFAIITYKNIAPNDFMKLTYNRGELYTIFHSKHLFVKHAIDEIDQEISIIKNEIATYDNIFISNMKDFRLLYLIRIIEALPGIKSFNINGVVSTIDNAVEDNNFEYLKTNNYSYNQLSLDGYNRQSVKLINTHANFTDIEKKIDPTKSYAQKEKEIIELKNDKINNLKHLIQKLEQDKKHLKNLKIAELLNKKSQSEVVEISTPNRPLLILLLRNGYIAEDYLDYISLFYEESITRADYQFHINVKNAISQPFDYKLTKIEKLIPKINPFDFQTHFILNYDLINHLLADTDKYNNELESILGKLKDESKESIEFIRGFWEITQHLEVFIKLLCNHWNNVWGYIDQSHDFTDESKHSILRNIIEYADINDIFIISLNSNITKAILSNPLFLSITDNEEKLKLIIKRLRLSFSNLDFENSSLEMLDFIYNGNHYQINVQMVTSLIKRFGQFDQVSFDHSNYLSLEMSNASNLIDYVNNNLRKYIENVYLRIESNESENESHLVKLLNNENLDLSQKESIITKVKTKISSLSAIKDFSLYELLLEKNKVVPTWENLLHDYEHQGIKIDKEIPKACIMFLNFIENAKELSQYKVPQEVGSVNIYGEFWRKLLQTNEIQDLSYGLITKSSPWWYDDLDFAKINDNKIKSLIQNTCIEPTEESFNSLKEDSDGLNILLFEKQKADYFKILDKLSFDSNDLLLILKSRSLTSFEKLKVLAQSTDESIITNNNLKQISLLLINDNSFEVNDNILKATLINTEVAIQERIKIFVRYSNKYDISFINTFLGSLSNNYELISDLSLKARIPNNIENQLLLNVLTQKGYISSFSEIDSDLRVHHKRK